MTDYSLLTNKEQKTYEFIEKYSKKYKCFVYNKKNHVTKVPGLEKYPWYIDNKLKEEIIKKTNNNELPITGGPCNNGVLMGIPYNSYQNVDQLIEAHRILYHQNFYEELKH